MDSLKIMATNDNDVTYTVVSLLEVFSSDYRESEYNPLPVLEGLLKVILSLAYYDIDDNGRKSFSPDLECSIEIRNELYVHSIFTQLIKEYTTSNYGLKIGLTPKESQKLRIISHYILMDSIIHLKIINDNNDSKELYEQKFEYALQQTTGYVLTRLKKLLDADSNRERYKIMFTYNVGNYLNISRMNVVDQLIYIFDYLNKVYGVYSSDFIQKYDLNSIFVKLFKKLQYDDNDDHRLLYTAFHCLSRFLNNDKFALKFIESDGLKNLLKVPRSKKVIEKPIKNCLNSLSSTKAFYLVNKTEKNIIENLFNG